MQEEEESPSFLEPYYSAMKGATFILLISLLVKHLSPCLASGVGEVNASSLSAQSRTYWNPTLYIIINKMTSKHFWHCVQFLSFILSLSSK